MRIVAGRFGGRRLTSVGKGDAGAHLRPTSDRVREALFSALDHLGVIDGARVMDVFAGTGALGLEALSRGASHAVFVENGRVSGRILAENIGLLGVEAETRILRRDATRPGPCNGDGMDLVFLDPPYGKGMGEKAVAALANNNWLAPGAMVVWEENAAVTAPPGFSSISDRKYGGTIITFLEYRPVG